MAAGSTAPPGGLAAGAARSPRALAGDPRGTASRRAGTSTAMMGVPTSTVWPSGTSSAATTPAYGLGSSTTALAVSISTMIWFTVTVSPGFTRQLTMSASVSPSPTSGRRNSRRCVVIGPVVTDSVITSPSQTVKVRSTASSTRSRSGR